MHRRTAARPAIALVTALAASLLLGGLAGAADPSTAPAPAADAPVVVIVSGLAADTPYTTPDAACATGLAAGQTDTYLRERLLAAGYRVYTSPAKVFGGVVTDINGPEAGPFGDCPLQLPADLTMDPVVSPLRIGATLAGFLRYLEEAEEVDAVHLVAHSMGGIFARVALADLQADGRGPRILSLTTIGSPWEPVMLGDFEPGTDPTVACDGNPLCLTFQDPLTEIPVLMEEMLPFVQRAAFVPWTEAQAGVLDGIPVTLIAGTHFTKDGGDPSIWPNDAVVHVDEALARDLPASILPHRTCHVFPDTHSLAVSLVAGLSAATALTWDPAVADALIAALDDVVAGRERPDREGCPDPS